MNWAVEFHDDFAVEFEEFEDAVQDELLAGAKLLAEFGPALSRPHCDTLKGSRFPNLKELRFKSAGGIWRAAFAFDRERKAILLCSGNKSGVSEARFYRKLVRIAEERFKSHMEKLSE